VKSKTYILRKSWRNYVGESLIIFDAERGEYIDTETGEVIEDRVVDQGPEWRAYDNQDRTERERTGPWLTLKFHDEGLSTRIGNNRIKDRIKLIKMQKLQNTIRVSKDRKLVTYLQMLNSEASKLDLPGHVKETAAFMLRKLFARPFLIKDPYALLAAVLYYSCEVNNVPTRLQEFKVRYTISSRELWKALRVVKEAAIPEFKSRIKPTECIPKVIDKLNLPPVIGARVVELIDLMYENGLTGGKSCISLTAGAVYVISALMDVKKNQSEIAYSLNVTVETVRNRYREIVKMLGPIVYTCKSCGYELHRFEKVGQDVYGVRTPTEIKLIYDGKCPRCGHELGESSLIPGKLEVVM